MYSDSGNVIPSDRCRTFDVDSKGGITFRDFLSGIAVIEPGTQHGGPPAEVRCRYIFRYPVNYELICCRSLKLLFSLFVYKIVFT
jgi:hypothetical protein